MNIHPSDILEVMPAIEIIEGGKIFELASSDWDHLHALSSTATPFQSRHWIQLWAKHFSGANSLRTIVIREGQDLVGLYPLVRTSSPWMAMRPAGVGPSDYLVPLMIDGQSELLANVHDALSELAKKQLVDLHQVPSDHAFAEQLSDLSRIEQAKCLILDLPSSFDAYVAGLSKSLRYDVRRLAGKALSERGATIEWATEETANEFADQFFELHKARWKSRGLPGAFFGKGERFQREWIAHGVATGSVVMNRLMCDGRSVGSVYAMRLGSVCYFYQAGMDPSASSLSPGTILVSRMIERAIETGCTTFDFMRGDEPYKRRWKPTKTRINYRILLPSQNVIGKTGIWWNQTAWRVELKVRERLEGKSLKPSKASNHNS